MFKNIIWDLVGKFGGQAVYFGISILLTRLLSPAEYGIMGMAMVVITVAHVFLELGFNRAIVHREGITPVQLSTIFYLNTAVAVFLTLVCFFIASPLAAFYQQPLIKPVFRVLSISFLLNGLSLVPASLLYKQMRFKIGSIVGIIASIISGIIGVAMAYNGYGVWSLVAQSLISTTISLIFTYVYAKWYPNLEFSIAAIKPLWAYGSRLFASGIIDSLYTRLDTFIIGKIFQPSTLGFYTRAQSMDSLVRQFSASGILSVLFPYITKHQFDKQYLKEFYLKYLNIMLFVSIGLSGVLFLIAKPLFTILFTSKWVFSAELFQLMAIMGFAWPVNGLMVCIISGVGNTAAFLRLEIYKKALFLPVYLFGVLFGIKGFIICMIGANFISIILTAFYTSKEVPIHTADQLKIIISYLFIGSLSCFISWSIVSVLSNWILFNEFSTLLILAISFGITYLTAAHFIGLKGISVISLGFQKLRMAIQ